ncbi:MAG: putative membrane protein [Chloroflexi bacterium AL-W]|nr:putative membrane protein [Chloroflexi bacterium AL-N1]NOK66768.1 putative membrane protein [Chloroflexi bacterium AL-N10]NOK74940.1 putative membrane protein [Chloroflexi bacterium AL-N5]NOK81371.1 putative membrane protein [Chloroflexi bacterium AL-W]NOK88840.1 putative membrane protein [Chloroflexi bacterium AL-N15]
MCITYLTASDASVTISFMAVTQGQPGAAPRVQPSDMMARLRKHQVLMVGLTCFIVALAIRVYNLGAQSLWLDEGSTWSEVTSKGWSVLIGDLISPNAAYPIYHLVLKGWVPFAGDSEWMLRFPSAITGAGAVVAIYLATICAYHTPQQNTRWSVVATMLIATSPFAIWYAQDTKVYSLLALIMALLLWASVRALNRETCSAWALVVGIALVSLFVHRLALLAVAGGIVAYVIIWPQQPFAGISRRWSWLVSRWSFALAMLVMAVVGVWGTIQAVWHESQRLGDFITAGPLLGTWTALTHFGVDQGNVGGWFGVPLVVWALPSLALTLWGLVALGRAAQQRDPVAIMLLCMFVVPLVLFAVALAFVPIYEARYAMIAFPAWILVVAYPFRQAIVEHQRRWIDASLWGLFGGVLLVNGLVLFQPQHGLFSGAPVKEQWREAITDVARRVHPDDLLILHPYYAQPMWEYYAPRVTPDPLPQPVVFAVFGAGDPFEALDSVDDIRRRFDRIYQREFNPQAFGKKRMLLLIAPDHARSVDPPLSAQQLAESFPNQDVTEADRYGLLGLRFQYPQFTWPCGGTGDSLIGVEVMCQSFPETFNSDGAGNIPQPAIPLEATFGNEIKLRGYSLPFLGDTARVGGSLPVTLYWEAVAQPSKNYAMFLHLCQDCTIPPLAQADGPPLSGHGDAGLTTRWIVGDPLHDERSIQLPRDLAPGRYTLLLGVYEPKPDARPEDRLRVSSDMTPVQGETRLVLGEVDIISP